ncbi:MAG TPA: restriction endonuclease [Dehalococcoidia bacterium]|nr:restriction endonuclease [Dehalococcoidia bacterium]
MAGLLSLPFLMLAGLIRLLALTARFRAGRVLIFLVAVGLVDLLVVVSATGSLDSPYSVLALAALYAGAVLAGLFLRNLYERRRRFHAATFPELLALTPRQFEVTIGHLLQDLGYRDVHHVGGSGDLAADLTCRDSKGRSVVVQCKRFAPGMPVGSRDVQSFIGMLMVHHRAEHGIFVTTSGFTAPASELARQHGLSLIGGPELAKLIGQSREGTIHEAGLVLAGEQTDPENDDVGSLNDAGGYPQPPNALRQDGWKLGVIAMTLLGLGGFMVLRAAGQQVSGSQVIGTGVTKAETPQGGLPGARTSGTAESRSTTTVVASRITATTAAAQGTQSPPVAVSARPTVDARSAQLAVSDANSALVAALGDLRSSTRTLANDTKFSPALAAYTRDWQSMQTAYEKMTTDAAKRPWTCVQLGTVQVDGGTVSVRRGSIQVDSGSLNQVALTVAADSDNLSRLLERTQTSQTKVATAVSANVGGRPLGLVGDDDANSAVAAAQQQLATSASTLADAQGQGAAIDQQAAQLERTAGDYVKGLKC